MAEENKSNSQNTRVEEKTKPSGPTKSERPTNCMNCNKPLKHKIWYYRNGKYYCTKKCWKSAVASGKVK